MFTLIWSSIGATVAARSSGAALRSTRATSCCTIGEAALSMALDWTKVKKHEHA